MKTDSHKIDSPFYRDRHEVDSTGAVADYTISAAAKLLGVHPNTLRKRIRAGKLAAHLVDGSTGQEYGIPAAAIDGTEHPRTNGRMKRTPPSEPDSTKADTQSDSLLGSTSGESQSHSSALESLTRAREMAAYTEELLAPWRRRVEEQAEEIGRLKAELHHAEPRLTELTIKPEQSGSPATSTLAAPWWAPWRRGRR